MRTLNPKMATTKRKQPASSNITSFFSPAPKRRAPEEHSVSADNSMQLPRDSMGQETRPPRPETEVATATVCPPFPLFLDPPLVHVYVEKCMSTRAI